MVQISAHCDHSTDAEPITYQSYSDILASSAEYAEFDIRKTADNVLVVYHDGHAGRGGPRLAELGYSELCDRLGYAVPRVDEVMALLAGRLIGHLDLKETGYEESVVALASSVLGPAQFRRHHPGRRVGRHDQAGLPGGPDRVVAGTQSPGGAAPSVGGRPAQRIVSAAPDPGVRC